MFPLLDADFFFILSCKHGVLAEELPGEAAQCKFQENGLEKQKLTFRILGQLLMGTFEICIPVEKCMLWLVSIYVCCPCLCCPGKVFHATFCCDN